jgi:hypothetical protein
VAARWPRGRRPVDRPESHRRCVMAWALTRVYTFTCDTPRCHAQQDIPAATATAARKILRGHGWSTGRHEDIHRCPRHKYGRREARAAGRRARMAHRLTRVEDYAELRSWGLTRPEAAARLGVTLRTADRYDAELRQRRQVAA